MNLNVADCERTLEVLRRLAPGGRYRPIRPPLEEDECHWFNRAVEDGVVLFGDCRAGCSRLARRRISGPDEFTTPADKLRHLFSLSGDGEVWLNREYVPHIAAYSRAILDYGYDRARSSFSLYRTYRRDLVVKKAGGWYETDAEFYDEDGIHLHIEAKARREQVARIVRAIERVSELRALPPAVVKEIEYVLDLGPRYLWVVGPGSIEPAAYVYRVDVENQNAYFTPVDDVPAPPCAPQPEVQSDDSRR